MHSTKTLRLAALSAAVIGALPFAASAQLEEIVVTARLRAESYAEAPAAIKAFTAAEIDSAGIETPHDYIQLTPNMTVALPAGSQRRLARTLAVPTAAAAAAASMKGGQ